MEKLKINKKRYNTETSVVSLRMPVELIEKIDDVSKKVGRTRNELIIKFIDFALDNLEVVDDSPD